MSLIKFKLKTMNIFAFILGIIVGFVFLLVDLRTDDVRWMNIALMLLPVIMVFIFFKKIRSKPISKLYLILSITVGIMSFIVDKMSTTIAMVILLIEYLIFFNLKEPVFSFFILGNCMSGFGLLISSINNTLHGYAWQGNRVPLHITIAGLFTVYLFNELGIKKRWTYIFFAILLITVFLNQSRTALLTCCIAFGLQFLMDMRGKLTVSKIILLVISLTIVFGVLYVFQDNIINLLFNKWGASTQNFTVSGRTIMWADVLSNIKLNGYGTDYTMKVYGVQNIHNGYVQAYVSYGIFVGIIYCIWKVVFIIKLVVFNRKKRACNLLQIVIPLSLMNIFESMFLFDPSYPYMGFLDMLLMGKAFQVISDLKIKHKNSN